MINLQLRIRLGRFLIGIREADSYLLNLLNSRSKKIIVVKKWNRNTQYVWFCHKSIEDAEPDEHRLGGIGEEKRRKKIGYSLVK